MKLKKRYIALYLLAIVSATLFQASRMSTNAARMAAIAEVTTGSSVKELVTSLESIGGAARQQCRGQTIIEFSPRYGTLLIVDHEDDSLTSYRIQDGSDHFTGPPFPPEITLHQSRSKLQMLVIGTLLNALLFLPFLLLFAPLSVPVRKATVVISIFAALFLFAIWMG